MSTEILVITPNKMGGNKYTTYLGLLESGASSSLVDKHILDPKSTSKGKTSETVCHFQNK